MLLKTPANQKKKDRQYQWPVIANATIGQQCPPTSTYISRRVRGRGPGRPPCQYPFRAHLQSARAVHADPCPTPHPIRETGASCSTLLVRNTHHEGYDVAGRQSVIVATTSATRLGVGRRCGGTLEPHEHETRSRRDRRWRNASENRRKEERHRAG